MVGCIPKNGASAFRLNRVLGFGSYETGWAWLHMLRIPDASRKSLHSFIVQAIEPGSIIRTDGWEGYSGLEAKGYSHEVRVIKGSSTSAAKLFYRLIQHAMAIEPVQYGDIIKHVRGPKKQNHNI